MTSADAIFDRYAPFIQAFIYQNRWDSLRGIQVAAGHALMNTNDHVLLCSSTASGKTEAAFFPILTEFYENPPHSVGALYIGPTKALINDQFYRLEDLCHEADIHVWHWHGDVSQSHKKKLLEHPSGILQITPESLEALLMHRHAAIPRLFSDLRYIVIDEVHSLIKADRGAQTLCLIERLSRLARVEPRRVALSATIGNPEAVAAYLSYNTSHSMLIPRIVEPPRNWRLALEHFFTIGDQAKRNEHELLVFSSDDPSVIDADNQIHTLGADLQSQQEPRTKELALCDQWGGVVRRGYADQHTLRDPGLAYIYDLSDHRSCLIFTNSREEAEDVCSRLRSYCELDHLPDRFLIHHGNLSRSIRESVEERLRSEDNHISVVATATLELGIDIGKLSRAFQIDAPFTISAFLQRMGRTGRREAPPEMCFVIREEPAESRALLPETIPWKLLQAIALIQLYQEEKWVEPPHLDRLPYSLLAHQTLATLRSEGELAPSELARRVLSLTPFHRISREDYKMLLQHFMQLDLVELTEHKTFIVGLAGERHTSSYKFYAVFQESVEYSVKHESQEIGTLVAPPPPGEMVAIAGHVWVVDEVDHERHVLYVTRVKGHVPAFFGLCPGEIYTRILERMQTVLIEQNTYSYLGKHAEARLTQARHAARTAHITTRPLVNLGENLWCLTPWLGTYAFLALERLLKHVCAHDLRLSGLTVSRPYFMTFVMKADPKSFFSCLADAARALSDPMLLLSSQEIPYFEKYDELCPPELIRKGFAEGILDVDGMKARVFQWEAQWKTHAWDES